VGRLCLLNKFMSAAENTGSAAAMGKEKGKPFSELAL
jgi:hypothetical protein